MNWQAGFDGLLALAAFWVVLGPARQLPALRLGCLLLGSAAVLGTLRFSGLLPLPQLHQFVSLLGAGVGLPLVALALVAPTGAVASQRRYTWIFAVIAAVFCVLLGVVAGLKLWGSVCAFASALAIAAVAARRRDRLALGAGVCMVLAFATFAAQLSAGPLRPGEFLHIGLALAMLLLGRWAAHRQSRP
ncbi:MAG: hypothetical protein RIS90_1326 [Pseudomonadota bacterium]